MMTPLFGEELAQWIGREVAYSAPEEVGRASIRYFSLALDDFNRLYRDDEFARKTRHGGVIAPPTFICETSQYMDRPRGDDGYLGHVWRLPPPPGTMLIRGGNTYEFFRPLRPSDRITATWRIVNISAEGTPASSILRVLSIVNFTDQNAEPLASNEEEMLYVPTTMKKWPARAISENRAGQEIQPLRYHLTTASMMAYGAATWDSHRYHYDADYARSFGHPSQFIDAQLLGALVARQLMDWGGPDTFLRRLSFFRKSMAYPDDVLTCSGKIVVTEVKDGLKVFHSSHDIISSDGREIVVGATASIDLPA